MKNVLYRWGVAGIACAGSLGLTLRLPVVHAASSSTPIVMTGTGAYVKLIVAFVAILLIMVILFRLLGKRVGVQQRGTVQVIAARQLAPNRSIQVVEVGQRRYLLGVGEDVQLLADVTDSYDVQMAESNHASFGQALTSAFADIRRNRPEDR